VRWSPDGTWLAIDEGEEAEDHHAHLVTADGQDSEIDLGAGSSRPLWSPSGDRIAYASGGGGGITVARADGSDARIVVKPGWGLVAWSPDGQQLLHVDDGHGNGFQLLSTSATSPGLPVDATDTVVRNQEANSARTYPNLGDFSWQPVRE
jgi:Tol biopolymer transport system component